MQDDIDPYSKGYNIFNSNKGIRNTIPEPNKTFNNHKIKNYDKQIQSYDSNIDSQYRSWDIQNINNFNTNTQGKNLIYGTDLMSIYETSDRWLTERLNSNKYNSLKPLTQEEINNKINNLYK